jgi:hypothetical protein
MKALLLKGLLYIVQAVVADVVRKKFKDAGASDEEANASAAKVQVAVKALQRTVGPKS